MTYELAIGDRTYSSWSLRGWLLFDKFGHDVHVRTARMYSDEFSELLVDFAPARLVPAARLDGAVVWDTFAIAEELNNRHPDAAMWPADPTARAFARGLVAEMHAGFGAIRSECTMNLRHTYPDFKPSNGVLKDVANAQRLWTSARTQFGAAGPWLFGEYSIADVFYAPLATRLATYHLPCNDIATAYVNTHLMDKSFRRWRAMGLAENYVQPGYDLELPPQSWPSASTSIAQAIDAGPSENEICPYSGKTPKYFLKIDGRIFGFCNAFCRDKTVADPSAWDAFTAVYKPT